MKREDKIISELCREIESLEAGVKYWKQKYIDEKKTSTQLLFQMANLHEKKELLTT